MLFATGTDREAPGEVVEAGRDEQASGTGVKEADRKVVGEEVAAAAETGSKYIVLM